MKIKIFNENISILRNKYAGRAIENEHGLPNFTENEEKFNMASHFVGVFIGIGAIIASITEYHSEIGLIGGIIFGLSLIIEYAVSSVYHGIPLSEVAIKKVFRLLDHCSIFILIAGTGTPFILSMIYKNSIFLEWLFYAGIWSLTVVGITLLCIDMKKYMSTATTMYVIIGVAIALHFQEFVGMVGQTGILLFFAGGIVYLIGLLFYIIGSKIPWMHSVFHVLCLIASTIHCVCVFGFLI